MRPATLIALFITLVVSACSARFVPFEIIAQPDTETGSGHDQEQFLPALIRHLHVQRGYAFAGGMLNGHYRYVGHRVTPDGVSHIYLFESLSPLYMRWAYIYLWIPEGTVLEAGRNSTLAGRLLGTSLEPDMEFQGTYRLFLPGTAYCSGETKEMPAVEGNTVVIRPYARIIRRSLREQMLKAYTPAYCQGDMKGYGSPGPDGMRFYFGSRDELERFARLMRAEFENIR